MLLRNTLTTSFDLLVAPFASPEQARPFAQTPAYEGGGRLSSDGTWLAYVSNESGRNQDARAIRRSARFAIKGGSCPPVYERSYLAAPAPAGFSRNDRRSSMKAFTPFIPASNSSDV